MELGAVQVGVQRARQVGTTDVYAVDEQVMRVGHGGQEDPQGSAGACGKWMLGAVPTVAGLARIAALPVVREGAHQPGRAGARRRRVVRLHEARLRDLQGARHDLGSHELQGHRRHEQPEEKRQDQPAQLPVHSFSKPRCCARYTACWREVASSLR